MAKKLPKTIYGKWNDEGGPRDLFLQTEIHPEKLVDVNERIIAGVYELVGYAEVKNTTTTTDETTVKKVGDGKK